MNYSLSIRKLYQDGLTWLLQDFYSIDLAHIIDISLDAKALSADNFLKIRGRKAKVTCIRTPEIETAIRSIEIHPSFRNTYLQCLVTILDNDQLIGNPPSPSPIFIGSLRNDTIQIDEVQDTITFYLSDALDTFIDIAKDKTIRLQEFGNAITFLNVPLQNEYPAGSLINETLAPFTTAFGRYIIDGFTSGQVIASELFLDFSVLNLTAFAEEINQRILSMEFKEFVYVWYSTAVDALRFSWFYQYRDSQTWHVRGYTSGVKIDNPFLPYAEARFEYSALDLNTIRLAMFNNFQFPTAGAWSTRRAFTFEDGRGTFTLEYFGQQTISPIPNILDDFVLSKPIGFAITAPLDFAIVPIKEGENTIADVWKSAIMSNRLSMDCRTTGSNESFIYVYRGLLPSMLDIFGGLPISDSEIINFKREGNFSELNKESFGVLNVSASTINALQSFYSDVSSAFNERLSFGYAGTQNISLLDKLIIDNRMYFVISISEPDENRIQNIIAVGNRS